MPVLRASRVLRAVALVASLPLLCSSPSPALAGDELAETLARMDQAAATFKGLAASIRKVSHTAVINEDTVDAGTIYVRRPKPSDLLVRFDIGPPNPKQVEFSGHVVKIYYPNSKTVEEYDLGKEKGMIDQFLLLGFGTRTKDLENAYTVRLGGPDTVNGEKTVRINLKPKSPDVLAHLKEVEMWIDERGNAVQQKVYEPGGDYLLATYSDMKINADIPDSALKLNLPKDVRRQRPQR
jgi:outer membrane lipoprotein-sorting protein